MTALRQPKTKASSQVILVFGENTNDHKSIRELAYALRKTLPVIEGRRKPLVLMKGRDPNKVRDNAEEIAKVVKAKRVRRDVPFILAHQDCDACEAAHVALSERIENELQLKGVRAIAVTPAWEIESWWYLWPEAVHAVNSNWEPLRRHGQHVGLVEHAKEELRRDLRPKSKGKSTRDYEESDSPKIANKVRELGIIGAPKARSDSFTRFAQKLRTVTF